MSSPRFSRSPAGDSATPDRSAIFNYQREIRELKAEVEALKRRIDPPSPRRAPPLDDEKDRLRQEIITLQQANLDLSRQDSRSKRDLQAANDRNDELLQKFKQKSDELKELERQYDASCDKRSQLANDSEQTSERLHDAIQAHIQSREESSRLQKELTSTQGDIERYERQIRDLKLERDELRFEKSDFQKQIAELIDQNRVLARASDAQRTTIANSDAEVSEIRAENQRSRADIVGLKNRIGELERQLQHSKAKTASQARDLEVLEHQAEETSERLQKQHYAKLKELEAALAEARSAGERLRDQNSKLKASVANLEEEAKELSSRNVNLQSENGNLHLATDRLSAQIVELRKEKEKGSVEELSRENEDLVERLADARVKLTKQRVKNDKLVRSVKDRVALQKQVQNLSDENEGLKAEISLKQGDVDALVEGLSSSLDVLDKVERDEGLQDQLEMAQKRNRELQKVVEALQRQVSAMRKCMFEEAPALVSGSPSGSARRVKFSDEEVNSDLSGSASAEEDGVPGETETLRSRAQDVEAAKQVEESENQKLRLRLSRLRNVANRLNEPKGAYARILSENEALAAENVKLKEVVRGMRAREARSLDG
jgi:chromosome segregation ATPase